MVILVVEQCDLFVNAGFTVALRGHRFHAGVSQGRVGDEAIHNFSVAPLPRAGRFRFL